jgi:hypothetical protein
MGVEMLLAGRVLRLPGVERADEFRQRVAPVRPRRMILRQQQARRVGRELTEGDAADVAALLQLHDVLGRRILELELAFAHCLRQQRGLEHLAQRCEIEQRIARDAPLPGAIGPAVIEERRPAVEVQRHGDAAGAVGRHDRLHLPRDDALGVPVGAGGGTAGQEHKRCRRYESHDRSAERPPRPGQKKRRFAGGELVGLTNSIAREPRIATGAAGPLL